MPDLLQLIHSDARDLPIADESVQCIVTSPPYWGLRKYSGEQALVWPPALLPGELEKWAAKRHYEFCAERGHQFDDLNFCPRCATWKGDYGNEPSIEMYVAHTVEILRELRRVLRPDGVLFWNIGDSYAAAKGYSGDGPGVGLNQSNRGSLRGPGQFLPHRNPQSGLKPKDMCLIPERVALAAQADGWWVRSRILWCKPNPMPESVTDRPTDAAEHIWMFTKSERYFWDADAVREPAATGWNGSSFTDPRDEATKENLGHGPRSTNHESRNLRNVWMFATQPYAGAHFATFPEELPRRCILAATSAKGACAQCGALWERVTRKTVHFESGSGKAGNLPNGKHGEDWEQAQSGEYDIRMGPVVDSQTIGWSPTCRCRGQRGLTVPQTVLDPFGGSGTTGRVAIELGRRAILADIAYGADDQYRRLAEERTHNVQLRFPGRG
jgi:DNA modification methylase